MCGAYDLHDIETLEARFNIDIEAEAYRLTPRYNIRPTQYSPVIVRDDKNQLRLMRWGLIPSWAKDKSVSHTLMNARAETIDTLPSYKKSFRSQRCLVPATGFYEWRATARGKVPYRITLKDEDMFGFAGLYDVWQDREGTTLSSYTIITTMPNELVAPIHDRMLAILLKAQEDLWIDPGFHEMDVLKAFLSTPYPAAAMKAYLVSSLVNSPRNDCPEVIDPAL
jgi:putative SOS response-associated peptidase YedK